MQPLTKLLRRGVPLGESADRDSDPTITASSQLLLSRSRSARVGHRLMMGAILARTVQPGLTMGGLALLSIAASVSPAAAQTSGSLLSGNSSTPVNTVASIINILVWVMLAVGIGGLAWGILNLMSDKAWGKQIAGGGLALSFAGVVAFINATFNDKTPALPTF